MKTVLPLLTEYLGSFLFTLVILSTYNILYIGISYLIISFLLDGISIGYTNPVISIVQYLYGKLSLNEMFSYIFVQIFAGITAFYSYKSLAY